MLNDRLKEARQKAKLTQKQVAEKAGIATTTYSGYERGASDPDVNTLGKIMMALNTDANFLYQDYNQEETKKSPAPEGTEEREQGIDAVEDKLRSLLLDLGLMSDSDLTAEQLEFLAHIVALIQAYFKK